jgi:hypothetical protein
MYDLAENSRDHAVSVELYKAVPTPPFPQLQTKEPRRDGGSCVGTCIISEAERSQHERIPGENEG